MVMAVDLGVATLSGVPRCEGGSGAILEATKQRGGGTRLLRLQCERIELPYDLDTI